MNDSDSYVDETNNYDFDSEGVGEEMMGVKVTDTGWMTIIMTE